MFLIFVLLKAKHEEKALPLPDLKPYCKSQEVIFCCTDTFLKYSCSPQHVQDKISKVPRSHCLPHHITCAVSKGFG